MLNFAVSFAFHPPTLQLTTSALQLAFIPLEPAKAACYDANRREIKPLMAKMPSVKIFRNGGHQ